MVRSPISVNGCLLCSNWDLKNYQTHAGFTTLHGLKFESIPVLQISLLHLEQEHAFTFWLAAASWSSDFGSKSSTLKGTARQCYHMASSTSRIHCARTSARELCKTQTSVRFARLHMIQRHVDFVHCIILLQQHSCRKVGIIELRVKSCLRLVPRPDHQKCYHGERGEMPVNFLSCVFLRSAGSDLRIVAWRTQGLKRCSGGVFVKNSWMRRLHVCQETHEAGCYVVVRWEICWIPRT